MTKAQHTGERKPLEDIIKWGYSSIPSGLYHLLKDAVASNAFTGYLYSIAGVDEITGVDKRYNTFDTPPEDLLKNCEYYAPGTSFGWRQALMVRWQSDVSYRWKKQPQKNAVPNDKDIPAGYELHSTFDLHKGDDNSDVLSSCEHLANQKTPFKAEFWNTNLSLPHWQNAHIDPETGKLETCHNCVLEHGYPYRILVKKVEELNYLEGFGFDPREFTLSWEADLDRIYTAGEQITQKGNTMTTYDKAVITKELEKAQKIHAVAVAEATKGSEAEVADAGKKFLATGKAQTVSVMTAVTKTGLPAYEDALLELSLIAGDQVTRDAISFNPVTLIKEAGKVESKKQSVTINYTF